MKRIARTDEKARSDDATDCYHLKMPGLQSPMQRRRICLYIRRVRVQFALDSCLIGFSGSHFCEIRLGGHVERRQHPEQNCEDTSSPPINATKLDNLRCSSKVEMEIFIIACREISRRCSQTPQSRDTFSHRYHNHRCSIADAISTLCSNPNLTSIRYL